MLSQEQDIIINLPESKFKKMAKKLLSIVTAGLFSFAAIADEGMWLPQLLQAMNESDMQANGLQLTAEDLYSVNNSSMKDAIVSLGGFCTAEMISSEGLMLTNHHCAFGSIQEHSSVSNDYLKDGFWAMSRDEELANEIILRDKNYQINLFQ